MIKIAIVGAKDCGKTTSFYYCANKLKRDYHSVGLLHEVARYCPYPLDIKGGFKTQMWILANQILQERELEEQYNIILCDRSVFDVYAYTYTQHIFKRRKNKFDATDGDLKLIEETIMNWATYHPYDLLIYLDQLCDPEEVVTKEDLFTSRVAAVLYGRIRNLCLTNKHTDSIRIMTREKQEREEKVWSVIEGLIGHG